MLRDKISTIEYEMMESYRYENAGCYSGRVRPMKEILAVWELQKSSYLSKILGDELIISKEVCIEKDDDVLSEEINEKLMTHTFINRYYSFTSYYRDDIINAIVFSNSEDKEYKYSIIRNTLLNEHSLLTNRYDGPEITLAYKEEGRDNFTKYKINSGTKVMKCISKLINIFCDDNFRELDSLKRAFEDFRIVHSQIFNEKTMKGELCVSIHPMDYMTMSDNDCGWRSCMAWRDEGEYRLGTVEMMNSSMVVVVYLKSSVDMHIEGNYSWNSKRWRELFVVRKDSITGIKGYPYWSRSIEKEALILLKELAYKNLGWEYHDTLYTVDCRDSEKCIVDHPHISISFYSEWMYCDFYSDHQIFLSKDIDMESKEEQCIKVYYSGPAQCMCCGEEGNFDGESYLLCSMCDDSWICEDCGTRMGSNEESYEVDGRFLCSYCYENLPICDCCGKPHFNSCFENVFIMIGEENDLTTLSFVLDDECLDSGELFYYSDVKTATIHYKYSDDIVCYVHYNDLTEIGKKKFMSKLRYGETVENYEGPFYYYD